MKRYGLSSDKIASRKELDSRLERAITGLETELTLKAAHCEEILTTIKATELIIQNTGRN